MKQFSWSAVDTHIRSTGSTTPVRDMPPHKPRFCDLLGGPQTRLVSKDARIFHCETLSLFITALKAHAPLISHGAA